MASLYDRPNSYNRSEHACPNIPDIPGYIIDDVQNTWRPDLYTGIRMTDGEHVMFRVIPIKSPREAFRIQHQISLVRNMLLDPTKRHLVLNPIDVVSFDDCTVIIYPEDNLVTPPVASLVSEKGMPLEEFFYWALKMSDTIDWVHQNSVLHGNIRPQSFIMTSDRKSVRIGDFSCAMQWSVETRVVGGYLLNQMQRVDLEYIAPEQIGRTTAFVDTRADLYSLGVTFFKMLTGTVPFVSEDRMEILHMHLAHVPPSVSSRRELKDTPLALDRIVAKLLEKGAKDRYESTFGMKCDLEKCWKLWRECESDQERSAIDFELATNDVQCFFKLPSKLYGRKKEIEILEAALQRVHSYAGEEKGLIELVMVEGSAGMGKSTLVQSIQTQARSLGIYASGKFDQMSSPKPFNALASCLRAIVHQILTDMPEQRLEELRHELIHNMNCGVPLLMEFVPEFSALMSDNVAPVGEDAMAMDADKSFMDAFTDFIELAAQYRTLTIFLDDMQWADQATIDILNSLTACTTRSPQASPTSSSPPSHHHPFRVLLILTSRTNVLDPISMLVNHPNTNHTAIQLGALELSPVTEFMADTLYLAEEDVEDLANVIQRKSFGVPFIITQFFAGLYREKLLWFDWKDRIWQYDLDSIESRAFSEMDSDLLTDRLKALGPETKSFVCAAACIGHIFSMDLVKSVLPTYINAFECLRISMGEGIIVRSDYNDFDAQFYHDRVQTCAYLMLPDDDRIRLHHAIGMKSLETMESADDRQVLFDVVYQLNKAVSLIKENGDTGLLRRLNFEAGCKAQVSYSVDKALEYFRIAENLLPEQAWDIDSIREEVFRLKLRIADCMRIVDDNANALLYATEALSHAKDQLEKSSVVVLCIQILHNGGKYTEAYEIANRFISDFMETIPLDATVEDANEAVREAATQLGRISIENIKRLLFSKDPYHIAIMNVLNVAATTAFFKSDAIFGLYTAAMVKRSLTHGLVPSSLVGFGYLAMYYSTLANNSESTFLIAETAYELSGTLDNLSRAKVLMAYALCSAERTCTPAPEFKELMQEAFDLATRAHDPMVAGIAACYRCANVFFEGTNLDMTMEDITQCQEILLNNFRKCEPKLMFDTLIDMVNALRGEGEADGLIGRSEERISYYSEEYRHTGLIFQLVSLYTNEEYDHACLVGDEAALYNPVLIGHNLKVIRNNFHGLALTALIRQNEWRKGSEEFNIHIAKAKKCTEGLGRKSAEAMVKTQPLLYLLETEIRSLQGDDVLNRYSEVAQAASQMKSPLVEALALELTGKHLDSTGQTTFGAAMLNNSIQKYHEWNAIAKVRILMEKHGDRVSSPSVPQTISEKVQSEKAPSMKAPSIYTKQTTTAGDSARSDFGASSSASVLGIDTVGSTDEIDLMSIIKAVQLLSTAIDMDKLLPTMMNIAAENAGATHCKCIIRENSKFVVRAEWNVTNGSQMRTDSASCAKGSKDFCESMVNLVLRTRKPALTNNASKDPNYCRDPYVSRSQPKSIACLPIVQNEVLGVLYLENTSNIGTFTKRHMDILEIICRQVAISFLNASLVVSLQEATIAKSEMLHREQVARAEAEAKEQKYRVLVDGMPNLVWTARPDGTVNYYNTKWEEYSGISRAELLSWSWFHVVHPDDRESIKNMWDSACRLETAGFDAESRLRRKDGVYRTHVHRGYPVYDANKTLLQWVGTCTDVEDQKKAQQDKELYNRLISSETRLKRLFDSDLAGIFFANSNGDIQDANECFIKLLGLKPDAISKNQVRWSDLTAPEHRNRDAEGLAKMAAKGASGMYEKLCVLPDGSKIWINFGLAQVYDKDDKDAIRPDDQMQLVGFVMDLSSWKEMERDLIAARETALQSTKLKSQFLANMSHELRTPFSGVLGFVNLLAETDLDPYQMEYVETCQQSCQRLLKIIDGILDYSKLEAGKVTIETTPFNIDGVLGDVCELLATLAGDNGLELGWAVQPNVPNGLLMDVGRLHQILMNLVGNAIKFTHQGEVFTTVSVQEETDYDFLIRFEISDTGIGMTAKEQMSLFQPFSQVDGSTTRLYGGTGLGLSICKELCRLMGGEIGIQRSVKGSGTSFFFTVQLEKLESRRSSLSSELMDNLPPLRVMVAVDSKNKQLQYEYTSVGAFQEVSTGNFASVVARLEHEVISSAPFNILIVDYTDAEPIIRMLEMISKSNSLAIPLRILIMLQPCTDKDRRLKQVENLSEMNKAGPNLKLGRLRKPPRRAKLLKVIEALLEDRQTPLTHGYPLVSDMAPRKPDNGVPQVSADVSLSVNGSAKNSKSTPQKTASSQFIDSSLKDLSILVAEDNPIAQKVILRQLQKFGFQHVSLASDGEEVVRKFQSMEQTPNIVFMDLHMPREDGLGATRRIRKWEYEIERSFSIPIIALTADVQDSTKENCHAAGMQDVLCKPVSQKQLMAQIIRWSKEKVPLVQPQSMGAGASHPPPYARTSSSSSTVSV